MIGYLALWSGFGLAVLGDQLSDSFQPVVGVEPSRQHLYQPSSDRWACLNDSSVVLSLDQINDGVCDCPDGSDEPGTGACGSRGLQFYCANEGFIPRYISQSKVGDGVCDCCDCSDELQSGVEPFYRGATCSELKGSYDKIVEAETRRYEEGVQALRDLYHKYNLDDEQKPVDEAALVDRINRLSKELMSNELVLSQTKARYAEYLMAENPMLYDFEQIDVGSIVSEVNASFEQVIEISKAYEDLVKILDSLQDNYARSLKDRVVNENVKKFNFLKIHTLSKLSCDSNVEEEQRVQLLEYFEEELPQIFTEGRVDKPPTYLIGKLSFVERIILGKNGYMGTVMSHIEQLRAIMSDVSENYNVNYQDQGVKNAVEAYKGWLAHYQGKNLEQPLTEKFKQNFQQLKEFISANADSILTSDSQDDMNSNVQGFLQHLNFLKNEIPKFFKPNLKNQIKEHEMSVKRLQNELKLNREEYEAIGRADENQDLERLKKLLSAISASHPIGNVIDNYLYEITFDKSVEQKENSPDGNQVRIGGFKNIFLQKDEIETKYFEYLTSKYPDEDDLFPGLINEIGESQVQYLIGSLHNINNGLALQYDAGDRCWNGPLRAAKVVVHCGKDFKIINVYETTKCNYTIDLEGPIGCNLSL